MQLAIEDRELITLSSHDAVIHGTYHKPREDRSGFASQIGNPTRDRVGILFFNGLYLTRAGNGDSAASWADSFAELGYPSFRIDLPGFGDSAGNPPEGSLEHINTGRYAPVTTATINELVTRFRLTGVVIVGHCAGAVSAIYAVAASSECKGLVIMDPYFHLPQVAPPKIRKQLNLWALKSRFGASLSRSFDILKQIRQFLRRNAPPKNANFALLRTWKDLASTGLPVLLIKAPGRGSSGEKPRTGEFDYLKHVTDLAGRRSRVVVKVVEGSNHSFSNDIGRIGVQQNIADWLKVNFPLAQLIAGVPSSPHSESSTPKRSNFRHNLQHLSPKVEDQQA
jgi:pimeloyl-ACP methyl ester carboxylesterase